MAALAAAPEAWGAVLAVIAANHALLFGATTYTFSLILAVFLFSHAGGMFLLLLAVAQAVRVLPLRWVLAAAAPMPSIGHWPSGSAHPARCR